MNQATLILIGAFIAAAASWTGMVAVPQCYLGHQDIVEAKWSGERYPVNPSGFVKNGAEVYRANGCIYCHTQQVRGNESDLLRWGPRRTVAQDYLFDDPVLMGTQRVGPDLTNVALRKPDETWHLLHLYNPKIVVPESIMPPYPYLFRVQKISGDSSPDALELPQGFEPAEGYEVVPTRAAQELATYLVHRKVDIGLEEAPIPQEESEESEKPVSAAGAGASTTPPPAYE